MAKELNIFVDNKPGRLKAVTTLLKDNNINIRALTIQDREDFGLMKIIVDKPNEAYRTISENGFACALKDILAIQIDDKPGGLDKLLGVFASNKINLKESYGFVIESQKCAVLCVEVENFEKVKKLIEENKFKLLEDEDLYKL